MSQQRNTNRQQQAKQNRGGLVDSLRIQVNRSRQQANNNDSQDDNTSQFSDITLQQMLDTLQQEFVNPDVPPIYLNRYDYEQDVQVNIPGLDLISDSVLLAFHMLNQPMIPNLRAFVRSILERTAGNNAPSFQLGSTNGRQRNVRNQQQQSSFNSSEEATFDSQSSRQSL